MRAHYLTSSFLFLVSCRSSKPSERKGGDRKPAAQTVTPPKSNVASNKVNRHQCAQAAARRTSSSLAEVTSRSMDDDRKRPARASLEVPQRRSRATQESSQVEIASSFISGRASIEEGQEKNVARADHSAVQPSDRVFYTLTRRQVDSTEASSLHFFLGNSRDETFADIRHGIQTGASSFLLPRDGEWQFYFPTLGETMTVELEGSFGPATTFLEMIGEDGDGSVGNPFRLYLLF